ncbi:hypothetical protein ECP03048163_4746 [Escherichia coli P0304816.3]|nr:hypothetical protein ECP03048163_4746 [Escherichia coli P0304816.3]
MMADGDGPTTPAPARMRFHDEETRHPTMYPANTSMMNAT